MRGTEPNRVHATVTLGLFLPQPPILPKDQVQSEVLQRDEEVLEKTWYLWLSWKKIK